MGVSGSGKGTLRDNLQKTDLQSNIEFALSYVTRKMRPGEISGDKYHFVSEESFLKDVENWDFLEYEWVHKAGYYGTKKKDVENGIAAGKIVFKEVDTKGLIQVWEKHPQFRKNYTSFFLDVANEEMIRRYLERHPDGDKNDIQNRLESANHEREDAKKYCDYIIDAAQSPEKVLQEVLEIIHTHHSWNSTS